VQGSFKAMEDNFSISLFVIFAHSDNLCGIFIFSRKSNIQSRKELKDFNSKETFSKKDPITDWEKTNTLDC